MKKMKLISTLSTLGAVAGAVPLVATACSSDSGDVQDYTLSNADNCNISGSIITVKDNTKDAFVTFSLQGQSNVTFYIEGSAPDGYTFTNNSTTLRIAPNTANTSGDKMNIKNSYKKNQSVQITVKATTNPDPKPEEEEVIPGYSVSCKTADENNLLTTQPGQFEKFVLSYEDVPYSYEQEPYIFWSVETLSGDTSVSPVFMDNYINAPGCGYLYCSYLNTSKWKPGTRTKIRVTASDYETGKVFARKTLELTRSTRTFYTPKANDLTLMNTIQMFGAESKFPLKLNEDKGAEQPEIQNVTWTIDGQLSTPAAANNLTINENNEIVLRDGASTETNISGYLTIKAEVADYDKPLYFCSNVWIGKDGVDFIEIPDGTAQKIDGMPYEYCNYFFVPKQNAASTNEIALFKIKNMSGKTYDNFYWTMTTKKNAVVSNTPFNFDNNKTVEPTIRLNRSSKEFTSIGYFVGSISLVETVDGKNYVRASRAVVISVVDEDTFEKIKNL